jgi:hypothetical protein
VAWAASGHSGQMRQNLVVKSTEVEVDCGVPECNQRPACRRGVLVVALPAPPPVGRLLIRRLRIRPGTG